MSIRSDIKDILEEAFTGTDLEGIKIVTSDREVGRLEDATILITSRSFGRFPQAPLRYLNAVLNVTIISAHQDLDRAEDELDTLVIDVMNALDHQELLTWSEATKTGYGDAYLSYEFPITVITSKE